MARLTKEQKGELKLEKMRLDALAEMDEMNDFITELPKRLLNLVSRASKYPHRMEVEFLVENNSMSMVTFWDKEDRTQYIFTYELATEKTRWELQEVEEMVSTYEWEERKELELIKAKAVALAKLSPEERKLFNL
jgi:hypothetical protein